MKKPQKYEEERAHRDHKTGNVTDMSEYHSPTKIPCGDVRHVKDPHYKYHKDSHDELLHQTRE